MMKFENKMVLIVEDDDDVITYLSMWFSDQGFEVCVAEDGSEAMARAGEKKPDLVTLDLVMPRKTGIRFYKEIKNSPLLSDVPVIIITGLSQESQNDFIEQEKLPPPDASLSKPFGQEGLLSAVEAVLSKA